MHLYYFKEVLFYENVTAICKGNKKQIVQCLPKSYDSTETHITSATKTCSLIYFKDISKDKDILKKSITTECNKNYVLRLVAIVVPSIILISVIAFIGYQCLSKTICFSLVFSDNV